MAAGDITFNEFTVGSLDLVNQNKASFFGMNIYEDILSRTHKAEVRVFDGTDSLGTNNINGKEDVSIDFSTSNSDGNATFKLKMLQNRNLDDGSQQMSGSMHSKTYDFKMISPEHLNAQANYVQKSYKDLSCNIVKDLCENYLKTDKEVRILEKTKIQHRIIFDNHHPYKCLDMLDNRHVSSDQKSSHLYLLFPNRDTYDFCTFDYLAKQSSPVDKFVQNTTIATQSPNIDAQMANLLWFKPHNSFDTGSRWNSASNKTTYNRASGKLQNKDVKSTDYTPPSALTQSPVYNDGDWNSVKMLQKPMTSTHISPSEDKDQTYISDARARRRMAIAHMSQNYVEFEVMGNPSIKLGSVLDLDVVLKANDNQGQNEKQINGKVLVVAIRHRIKPSGFTPNYTMIIRAIKAGFDQGGGNG